MNVVALGGGGPKKEPKLAHIIWKVQKQLSLVVIGKGILN
jgi:hypothetical protein